MNQKFEELAKALAQSSTGRRAPRKFVFTVLTRVLFSVAMVASSAAAPITVNFDGTIDTHFGAAWVQPGFAIGDHFVGQYMFESLTPGNKFATQFGGIPPERTPYPNALLSFTATSQGVTATSPGDLANGILVDDNFNNNDSYFVLLISNDSEIYIDLRSRNLGLFNSQALPLEVPGVDNFDAYNLFRIRTGDAYAEGHLDRIAVVPEPSIWALLGGGALVVILRHWLRQPFKIVTPAPAKNQYSEFEQKTI